MKNFYKYLSEIAFLINFLKAVINLSSLIQPPPPKQKTINLKRVYS